jgi:hypothetical protein
MIHQRGGSYPFSDWASESGFKTQSQRSGPSQERSQVLVKQTETTGSRMMTKPIVTNKTDVSSNLSTSKRFAHQYSQSGHHRQSDEKQKLTHGCLLKLWVNHRNRVQRQTHRGAGCQDLGPARGSGWKPFNSMLERRSKRQEKSVDRGKNKNRHLKNF